MAKTMAEQIYEKLIEFVLKKIASVWRRKYLLVDKWL